MTIYLFIGGRAGGARTGGVWWACEGVCGDEHTRECIGGAVEGVCLTISCKIISIYRH